MRHLLYYTRILRGFRTRDKSLKARAIFVLFQRLGGGFIKKSCSRIKLSRSNMAYLTNLLHKKIGDIISYLLKDSKGFILLKDQACGGNQHIPLFCTPVKSRETEYCNVDLMVLKGNKIKVILEIEESNVKPTQVCGKFLTSALSHYFVHESQSNKPVEMDSSVTLIQIVDSSKLDVKTKKIKQWNLIEKSIKTNTSDKGKFHQKLQTNFCL